MKVGILTSFYPEIHGGAEASLAVLLNGLKSLNLDPTVFTLSQRQPNVNGGMIKVGRFGRTPKIVKLSGFPGLNSILAHALSKSLREHGLEILHANDTYALRAAAKAAQDSKIPLVLSFHNNLNIPFASYGVPFPLSSWLDSREKGVLEAARKCSLIIATSKYVAERLIAAGLPPAIVKPIYIGGAISSWGSPTPETDSTKIRVLSVGTMQYHKGFQNMVIAAKKIRSDGISPEVIIVGDGPYRNKLRNLVIKLGVTDEVKLPGRVGPKELTTLFDWCDTVVVPTITPEPFGRVAVEAMSRGRSVIGTQAGGLTEIIDDGETGFLVPPGDSSAIAEKLVTFRNHPHLLTEMGERALAKCKATFEEAMIANQVLEAYRSMAPNA